MNSNITSPESIRQLYVELCAVRKFDAEAFITKTSVSLFDYGDYTHLLAAHNYLEQENYYMVLIELHWVVEDCFERYRVHFASVTQELVEKLYTALSVFVRVKDAYADFLTNQYPALLATFYTPDLYNEGDLTASTISPEEFVYVNKALKEDMFRGYTYQQGSAPIEEDLFNYALTSKLGVTDKVESMFGASGFTEQTRVSLVLVLEEPVEYSYFIFIVRYKDHVWLYTDNIEHQNPLTKVSSRKPGRKVEKKLETVALPYRVIREVFYNQRGQLIQPGKAYFNEVKDIREYFTTLEKFFVQNLLSGFLTKIHQQVPARRLVTTTDYLRETKLLGELVVNNEPSKEFDSWNPKTQAYYHMLTEGLNIETGLVRLDPAYYVEKVGNWLATPDKFEQMSRWLALDQQRERIQKELDDYDDSHDQRDRKAFNDMVLARLDRVLIKITQADRVLIRSDRSDVNDYKLVVHERNTYNFPTISIGSYNSKDLEQRKKQSCRFCNIRRESKQFWLVLRDWDALVWLLDLKTRFELPQLMRNYATRTPGVGNTILDNVHPLANLRDPFSRDHRHSVRISVEICKTCWNNAVKANRKTEEVLIDLRADPTKSNTYVNHTKDGED